MVVRLIENRIANNQTLAFFSLQEVGDGAIYPFGYADPKFAACNFNRRNASQGLEQTVIWVQAHHHGSHRKIAQNIILAPQVKIVNLA